MYPFRQGNFFCPLRSSKSGKGRVMIKTRKTLPEECELNSTTRWKNKKIQTNRWHIQSLRFISRCILFKQIVKAVHQIKSQRKVL